MRAIRVRACSTRSRKRLWLARLVSESWSAWWASWSSRRRRSVTSRKHHTRPDDLALDEVRLASSGRRPARRGSGGRRGSRPPGARRARRSCRRTSRGWRAARARSRWRRRRRGVARRSSGSRHSSTNRRLKLLITPSWSTTRIPSSVASSVELRSESVERSSASTALRVVRSWPDTTKERTVGSSRRLTIVSSTGIGAPCSPCSISTSTTVAPAAPCGRRGGGGEARAEPTARWASVDEGLERPTDDDLGVAPDEPDEGTGGALHDAVGRHDHHQGGGVVHERPELRLVVVGDLEGPAVGEVPDREHEGAVGGAERRADELHQPPAVLAQEPDLDRQAERPSPACSGATGRRCRGRRGARGRGPTSPPTPRWCDRRTARRPRLPHRRRPAASTTTHRIGEAGEHREPRLVAQRRAGSAPRDRGVARWRSRRMHRRIPRSDLSARWGIRCRMSGLPGAAGPMSHPLRRVGLLPPPRPHPHRRRHPCPSTSTTAPPRGPTSPSSSASSAAMPSSARSRRATTLVALELTVRPEGAPAESVPVAWPGRPGVGGGLGGRRGAPRHRPRPPPLLPGRREHPEPHGGGGQPGRAHPPEGRRRQGARRGAGQPARAVVTRPAGVRHDGAPTRVPEGME